MQATRFTTLRCPLVLSITLLSSTAIAQAPTPEPVTDQETELGKAVSKIRKIPQPERYGDGVKQIVAKAEVHRVAFDIRDRERVGVVLFRCHGQHRPAEIGA